MAASAIAVQHPHPECDPFDYITRHNIAVRLSEAETVRVCRGPEAFARACDEEEHKTSLAPSTHSRASFTRGSPFFWRFWIQRMVQLASEWMGDPSTRGELTDDSRTAIVVLTGCTSEHCSMSLESLLRAHVATTTDPSLINAAVDVQPHTPFSCVLRFRGSRGCTDEIDMYVPDGLVQSSYQWPAACTPLQLAPLAAEEIALFFPFEQAHVVAVTVTFTTAKNEPATAGQATIRMHHDHHHAEDMEHTSWSESGRRQIIETGEFRVVGFKPEDEATVLRRTSKQYRQEADEMDAKATELEHAERTRMHRMIKFLEDRMAHA